MIGMIGRISRFAKASRLGVGHFTSYLIVSHIDTMLVDN